MNESQHLLNGVILEVIVEETISFPEIQFTSISSLNQISFKELKFSRSFLFL